MKKITRVLQIVLFIVLLLAPNVLFWLFRDRVDTTNYEKRTLAPFPAINISAWADFPGDFDAYVNDNAAFKNQFVQLYSLVNLRLFHMVESDQTLLGEDQWLFNRSGHSLEDYQAADYYSEEELIQILDTMIRVRDYYAALDIDFVVFLAPNKEQIYGEYMPDDIEVYSEYKRLDQIVDYIRDNSDVTVVYPKEELLAAKDEFQVYYKYDSHWNNVGAFIAAQQLIEATGGQRTDLADLSVVNTGPRSGDLAQLCNLSNVLNDDNLLAVAGYLEGVPVSIIEESSDHNFTRAQSTGLDDRTLLMIRDSFGAVMMPYLERYYQNTIFVHRDAYSIDFIDKYQPDIVVYQVVERLNSDVFLNDNQFPDIIVGAYE